MTEPNPRKELVKTRPTDERGEEYVFDCCGAPMVYWHADGSARCKTCGRDWSEEL